jgi:putative heme transporter
VWFRRKPDAAVPTPEAVGGAHAEPPMVHLDTAQLRQLSAVFSAPRWLRDVGIASWLLVGLALLLVGMIWLVALTNVIVVPVIVGLILATVTTPAVSWLQRKRLPRIAGALIVLLALLALGVLILLLVVGGIVAQGDQIREQASAAADQAQQWLQDAGVDEPGASSANENVSDGVASSLSTFLTGLANTVRGVTALVFFVVFSTFSVLFLLKDGPG